VHKNGAVSISGFSVSVDQNPYLPAGGRDVSAIVTVTANEAVGPPPGKPPAGGSAEIIIIDCSASMGSPPTKLGEARAATATALDIMRDGTWFAIIAGTSTARPVYPSDGSMAVAGQRTRAEARAALGQLRADGGTAIGQWLRLAHRLFSSCPAMPRHAILLADGRDSHETPEELTAAIALCEGVFRCDCRGLGADWDAGELRKIAAALLGSVDVMADPAGLTADFAELMLDAVSKQLPDVLLRVWTPRPAVVRFVRQVAPAVADLTGRRVPSGALTGDYPTGAWAPGESRDYHVGVTVSPAEAGQEMLAARVSLVTGPAADAQVLGRGLIRVTWTDEEAPSNRLDPRIADYTTDADEMTLDTRSTRTARSSRVGEPQRDAPPPPGSPYPQQGDPHARPGALPPQSGAAPSGPPLGGPPLGGGPAHQAGPGGPPSPDQRFLLAQLPARVPVSAEVSLVVRISVDLGAAPAAKSAPLRGLAVGPAGTAVTVVVQAPSDLVPRTALQQVITVPPAGDPPPVRFEFLAARAGLQRVVITAWAGGTFLAELGLELSVHEGGRYADAPARWTPVGPVLAREGEVTLQVRFDGQRYTFQLLSEPYLFEPVFAEELTAHPSAAVERTVATLRSIAEGSSGYSSGNARTWMEQAGVGLWNDMVPERIKDQFWQLREHIGAFSIVAGGDVIPWELLYPLAPGHDEGFLVEQFPVMRRVYGQQRSRRLAVTGARYVLPARSPANAEAEIAAIRTVLGGKGEPAETIADLGALLGFIESGSCGSLHFACHNTFKSDAGGSAITMGGGSFVPMLLNKAVTRQSLAGRNPLIFINACGSAGAVPEYTSMTSWAQQFMAAGAGAFVGTMWAVGSTAAQVFAEAFYAALASGDALGEASRRARVAAGRDHDDPTWLAYSVYGDPAARFAT
jgi:CHAT domain/von Willebrand factor type A domain